MKRFLSPPMLYQLCILFMLVLHFMVPIYQFVEKPYTYAGAVLFVAGVLLAVKAKRQFQEAGTPMRPSKNRGTLHTEGAFRISRNPMYLGIFVGLVGISVLLGSAVTFIFPLIFFVVMNNGFIPYEERLMEKHFGDEYREYLRTVRRWL